MSSFFYYKTFLVTAMSLATFSIANAENYSAGGGAFDSDYTNQVVIGSGAVTSKNESTAVGEDAHAIGERSTAIGKAATATEERSSAFGNYAQATGERSTALGTNTIASGEKSTAVGNNANASGEKSTAVGTNTIASGSSSTALGDNANASGNNSIALGSGSVADRDNTVSVGFEGGERQITNVAKGVNDTDAVNMSQLKEFSGDLSHVQNIANQNTQAINKLSKDLQYGLASQAALNGLFQPYNIERLNTSVALGGYGSETAIAIGSGYRFNEKFATKSGLATSTSSSNKVSYNVGVNFEW